MVEDEESTNAETEGGYAKEMSDEYKQKQAKLIAETIAKQDIVICTALIPGKKAPVLISQEMVESMASGSVVVDLAVEAGGNCPLSKEGEVIDHGGVKIVGYANVPGRVAKDASALYAKNIFNFLSLIINKEDKKINFNWEDEIVNAVTLTHEGKLRLDNLINMEAHSSEVFVIGLTVFFLLVLLDIMSFGQLLQLYSPLMGVTNAISSVIIVGAILAAGPLGHDTSKIFGIIGCSSCFYKYFWRFYSNVSNVVDVQKNLKRTKGINQCQQIWLQFYILFA